MVCFPHAALFLTQLIGRAGHTKKCVEATNSDILATLWDQFCRDHDVCGEDPSGKCHLGHHGKNVAGTQRKKMLNPVLHVGYQPERVMAEDGRELKPCKHKSCKDASGRKVVTSPPCGGFYRDGVFVPLADRNTETRGKDWADPHMYGTIYPDMVTHAAELLKLRVGWLKHPARDPENGCFSSIAPAVEIGPAVEAAGAAAAELPEAALAAAPEPLPRGRHVHFEDDGHSASAGHALNSIHQIVMTSQLGNLAQYAPTDCPTREKH